jgi:hypothetical protein
MSTIVGQSLIYALEEALERQEEINKLLLTPNNLEAVKVSSDKKTALFQDLLTLCKRTF